MVRDTRITEERNPATTKIDTLQTAEILKLINREDALVAPAVQKELPVIEEAVEVILSRMKKGGRLIYIGTGTSGRLGVLDAVESVPTFRVERGLVHGILAGGEEAFFQAREGLEDDYKAGGEAVEREQVREEDVLLGITASGHTPFVLGAVKEAKRRGAYTIGLSCNRPSLLEEEVLLCITPLVGPEVIAGSTRMKAGTAQKMVLNMISTTVMIRLGKVYSNLMVDLKPSNKKLRDRALHILCELTQLPEEEALWYLKESSYHVKAALVMIKKRLSLESALSLLEEREGRLHEIL